jgi:hypothetical protein
MGGKEAAAVPMAMGRRRPVSNRFGAGLKETDGN